MNTSCGHKLLRKYLIILAILNITGIMIIMSEKTTTMEIYVSDWLRINKQKDFKATFPETIEKILNEYEILKRKEILNK